MKIETFCPGSRAEWRQWLAQHHQTHTAVWLVFYKASTGVPSLSWSEAVDEALCFGWIDSTKQTLDAERYQQYFTRRKPKSNWSKVNKEKVAALIAQGQMTAAGQAAIDTARANGSWAALDAVEALAVPPDLAEALAQHPGARDYYESLSKSIKKQLLYWVLSAKRPATRQKRVGEVAHHAHQQQLPPAFRQAPV